MLLAKSLSPEERERLDRLFKSASKLSRLTKPSQKDTFFLRHQVRIILQLLGSQRPTKMAIGKGIEIVHDAWPFKMWRLKKLIYGRRQ